MILLDFSKAFDTVNHATLLQKLKKFNFHNDAILFLKSYLCNRYQRVKIGNVFCDWKLIRSGVPQGSILGPLLFLLYVNDIDEINLNSLPCQFADDIGLMITAKDIQSCCRKLEEYCNKNDYLV